MKKTIRITAFFMAVILFMYTAVPVCEAIVSPVHGLWNEQERHASGDTAYAVVQDTFGESDISSIPPVYEEGVILLYTYEQLCAVGSGQPVTDGDAVELGSGNPLTDDMGNTILYRLDASYRIAQDIELPKGETWILPAGFTGTIMPKTAPENAAVYNVEKQAIYLYHPYQLAVIAQDDAAQQPVLADDWNSAYFGIGNLIYPDGEDGTFLTYSPEHRYIVSADFCSDTAEPMANTAVQNQSSDQWGRDFAGQVIKEINGETYILIGNAQQMRAIGSDDPVYTAVYQAVLKGRWQVDTDENGNPIMLYGGDADLTQAQNGHKDYTFGIDGIENADGGLFETVGRCGVNQQTGEIDPKMDIEDSGQTYSMDANYIIFRNIDLNGENWTPLTFSGTMIGATSQNGEPLWDDTSITATGRPVISNITVKQTTPLEVNKYIGIGFFSTISNQMNINNVGVSAGQVMVSNLELSNVSVQTLTSSTEDTQTILNALTSGLGWIVGGALDLLLPILTFGNVQLSLKDTLSELLNARADNPTRFATGAFAGRIEGDVVVENCVVTNAKVQNVNNYTGGFVGYSTGVTEYDGLSDTLKLTVNVLSSLLNAIPGLGLGDLVTVLLNNVLPVDKLIPTGYYNPVLRNCHVVDLNQDGTVIGGENTDYAGGFVGAQVGTRTVSCSVSCAQTYNVQAISYAGGFAGIARDAEIKGLLSEVGIELLRVTQPQSLLLDCQVSAPQVTVTGGDYLGGFVGALTNSYAINDTITGSVSVKGAESCIGGFAGIATVGWISNLGKNETTDASLLSTVKGLLTRLLSTDPSKAQMLLSLVGIQPSAVMGCQVNSADTGFMVVVSGNSYVGGFIGKGDGAYLTESSQQYLNELPLWKWRLETSTGVQFSACFP